MFEVMKFYSTTRTIKKDEFSHCIMHESSDFVIIHVDMSSYRFQVDSLGFGGGELSVGLDATPIDHGKDSYEMVQLSFDCPNDNWDIVCAQTAKKTVIVVIANKDTVLNYENYNNETTVINHQLMIVD